MQRAATTLMPSNWTIEPLPDGTIRLYQPLMKRLGAQMQYGFVLGTIATMVYFVLSRIIYLSRSPFTLLGVLSAFGVLLLVMTVVLAMRSELRVGQGFLEKQWYFLLWTHRKRLDGGVFVVREWITSTRSGRYRIQELATEGVGGKIALERDSQRESFFGGFGADLLLPSVPQTPQMVHYELDTLGKYLSAQTGWHYVSPYHISGV